METRQNSQYDPAVIDDGVTLYRYHMLFCSQDPSNRLLYCDSLDGQNWNYIGQVGGNTTGSSPAIALSQETVPGGLSTNLLVAVFVANDPSQRMLYATLDLNEDRNRRGWRDGGQVGTHVTQGVSALAQQNSRTVNIYYISDDPSQRILEIQFTP